MSVRVCTSIWGTAWERYGKGFAESFTKYWDPSIELFVTVDKKVPFDRAQQKLLEHIPSYALFDNKWKGSPRYKSGPIKKEDLFKYDAAKWAPQAITPNAALEHNSHWVNNDILIWTDADSEFYDKVDENWVESVLGNYDVAALQRPKRHTEIGFFALRLNKNTRAAMYRFSELFVSYDIFGYDEWHSGYAWDIAMKESDVNIKDLNTTGSNGHPFPDSVLAEKIIHNKGELKGPYEGLI